MVQVIIIYLHMVCSSHTILYILTCTAKPCLTSTHLAEFHSNEHHKLIPFAYLTRRKFTITSSDTRTIVVSWQLFLSHNTLAAYLCTTPSCHSTIQRMRPSCVILQSTPPCLPNILLMQMLLRASQRLKGSLSLETKLVFISAGGDGPW